ncbi:uncharacterized protein LOC125192983 [Salvia hispanica]|uniref:uncharacterized protein LOC125192983 n=1 Tax=Salvia hispanica TaxID=49212 RepID=UPI002009C862|nr:uncharacterized protein LOC125192983 [Salvia hispanica]
MVNACLGRRRHKPKGDRTRRSWTEREEETLVVWLKEISVTGWKADNGFRAGYLTQLENAMKQQFPNTDIKGTPQINSKLTAWKKLYNSLVRMLDRSGVGFNIDYKIDCDDH